MNRSLAATIEAANAALVVDGNVDAIGDFFAPDYVAHLTGSELRGHDAVRGYLASLRSAFPDLRVELEILLEGQDRVAWQRTLQGTQQGSLRGFPACGRTVVWRDMVTSRFRNGLIAEEWAISELAERLLAARKGPGG